MNVELETGDFVGSGRKTVNLPDHLDLIATAPDGIQKLRGLILELAVRGKLVPQDPRDEPAGELLKRIAEERARREAEGSCKKSKATPPVADDEQPYKIPNTWVWTRLPDVYFSISPSGNKLLSSEIREAGNVPVVDQGKRYVAGYTDDASLVIKIPGPVVIFGDHTTERKYIDFDFVAGADGIKILRPILQDEKFFFRQLQAFRLEERGYARHFKVLNGQLYALPPLAEQHRIVAKVDELMALCDRLAAEQADAESAHARLVETLLGTLTQCTDAADLAANWHRLAEHFNTLFTTESSLDALKQTILQLAVMGKLVPQDPNDEPASELLKRIAKQRSERLSTGYPNPGEAATQSKKQEKQVCPQNLVRLPHGWSWATLMQCAELVVDCHNKTAPYSSSGIPLLRTTNIRDGSLNLREPKFVSSDVYERWSARCKPESGDLLITREAPMGEVCIIPDGMTVCMGQRMMLIRLVRSTVAPKFLLYSLLDPNLMDRVQDKPVGATVEHLRVGGVETLLVQLPPLAEQHRIVAKVDELMALCDHLKADLADARNRRARLATTLIDTALRAA